MTFDDNKLYAVGEVGGFVAGHVRRRGKLIEWFAQGGRSRAFAIDEVLDETDDVLRFLDAQGREHELFVLTPTYYNKFCRRPQDPKVMNEREMLEAYERSKAW